MKTIKQFVDEIKEQPLIEQVRPDVYRLTMAGTARCLELLHNEGLYSWESLPEPQSCDADEYNEMMKKTGQAGKAFEEMLQGIYKWIEIHSENKTPTQEQEIDNLIMVMAMMHYSKGAN
jgi:hypothetical protein